MKSFFSELQRRNVYKIGVMYAVAGWLVVQIATQVLPVFEVSPLVLRVIVLVIVAGFPIALVLSWIYELTPAGIERTSAVPADRSITRHTGQKLNWVVSGILALAVVFLVAQRYWSPPKAGETALLIADKSVAVLPFENLSDEKANAFFAQGIQDEILTRLAKIGALKVISRTSTQHYASSPDNLPEIARQLGVANILEGSVQRAGDAVHINVQLIHAATDNHLWAEVYNRKLVDIFAVEAEVAGAIADTLNAKLTGAEHAAVSDRPTENQAAHDAYLRGLVLADTGYGYENTRKAIDEFAEAVRLDPKFAAAWGWLEGNASYLYFNGVDTAKYTPAFIKHAADTAFALQPNSSEALQAQADYKYRIERDYEGARKLFESIVQQDSNNKPAVQYLALVERRMGLRDQSLTHLLKASTLDPRDAGLMTTIGGESLANERRWSEAHDWLQRALNLSPGDSLATAYSISVFQLEGRLEDAERVISSVPVAAMSPSIAWYRAQQRILTRDYARAIVEITPLLAETDQALDGYGAQLTAVLGIAQFYSGQKAQAKATLDKVISTLELKRDYVDDSLMSVSLAYAYAYAGRLPEGIAQARHAQALYANDHLMGPNTSNCLAVLQAMAGEQDAAIDTLATMLSNPGGTTIGLLSHEPYWDQLRANPRFQALLKTSPDDSRSKGPQ